jgi:hypothetical protein
MVAWKVAALQEVAFHKLTDSANKVSGKALAAGFTTQRFTRNTGG